MTDSSNDSSTARDPEPAAERYVSRRTVAAPAATVFAVLADPSRHQDTEPRDWVRTAVDPAPITEVGQVFGMNMFMEALGGHYVMHNRVVVFEPDRAIAWEPGQLDDKGELSAGGWFWRYDLAPAAGGNGTDVTLTYDWSATPPKLREEIGRIPPFRATFLEKSLATLAHTVEAHTVEAQTIEAQPEVSG